MASFISFQRSSLIAHLTPLNLAVSRMKPDIVEMLLSQPDIDPARGDYKGRCPLHRAVRRNCMEIMQLFRERASPPNVRDHLKYTPLHYAVTRRPETLRMLLTFQGIDVNVQNQDGDTPLHIAALKGCVEQSRILLGTIGVNPHLRSVFLVFLEAAFPFFFCNSKTIFTYFKQSTDC
jgi:ankyrin repeat protein